MGKKGQIPWNKGIPNSGFKKGYIPYNKGKKLSTEQRKKMRLAHLGEKNHFFGKKHTIESKEKMRINGRHWKGGVSTVNHRIRNSYEYRIWQKAVWERDKWRCVWCGIRQGWNKKLKKRIIIDADHIKSFAEYPELRFAIDNGRTLCRECHKTTENYGKNIRFKK